MACGECGDKRERYWCVLYAHAPRKSLISAFNRKNATPRKSAELIGSAGRGKNCIACVVLRMLCACHASCLMALSVFRRRTATCEGRNMS